MRITDFLLVNTLRFKVTWQIFSASIESDQYIYQLVWQTQWKQSSDSAFEFVGNLSCMSEVPFIDQNMDTRSYNDSILKAEVFEIPLQTENLSFYIFLPWSTTSSMYVLGEKLTFDQFTKSIDNLINAPVRLTHVKVCLNFLIIDTLNFLANSS